MPPKKKLQKAKITEDSQDSSTKAGQKGKKTAKMSSIKNEDAIPNSEINLDSLPKVKPPNVKAFKESEAQPNFPIDYQIVKNCLLQVTDIKDNHNKFYSMELHSASDGKARLFTHYGRTDDLQRGSNCGQKETRYYDSLAEAYAAYNDIYKKKTAASKGYKPLNLVRMNSNIGSNKLKGKSAGSIDDKTLKKLEESKKPEENTQKTEIKKTLNLHPMVEKLVSYIYDAATTTLTAAVSVQFTSEGIKTPLGVLTIEQIEKGEDCLSRILEEIKKKNPNKSQLESLSSEFFTMIPHHLGRSQASIKSNIITTEEQYTQKMELMQLMKDLVSVSGSKEGNVLIDPNVEAKYKALGCEIRHIEKNEKEFKDAQDYIQKNLAHHAYYSNYGPNIQNIFEITRREERKAFLNEIGNEKLMFHGSRIANWVGILSRGILLPNAVTKLGVHRTDFGWLGAGIYFGDVWTTSANYTGTGKDGTRFMLMVNVALGKIYDQAKIDGSITKPPKGYDTIHGNPDLHGGFSDHEYCIYEQNQQHIKYLVEFK